MTRWLHALACVAVPALIGGFMYLAFNLLGRRLGRRRPERARRWRADYQI